MKCCFITTVFIFFNKTYWRNNPTFRIININVTF